jgi:hypothetical protein
MTKNLTSMFVVLLCLALLTIPNGIAQAASPDRYVFEFNDSHYAPRLSAFCGFPVIVGEWGTIIDNIYYDNQGNFTGENMILRSGGVSATNGLTGKTLSSPSDGLFKYGLDSASVSGLGMHFVLPGGEQILLDAGRITIDYETGERTFEAGTHDYQDGNWQALCNGLAG